MLFGNEYDIIQATQKQISTVVTKGLPCFVDFAYRKAV